MPILVVFVKQRVVVKFSVFIELNTTACSANYIVFSNFFHFI